MKNRRDVFSKLNLEETTNAGLWLDKFLGEDKQEKKAKEEKEEGTAKSRLVKEVAKIKIPHSYEKFYERWKTSLTTAGAKTRKAEVKGRMVVGLGAESVLETSVALHRTYGVPFIPGSALKGLAASYSELYLGWVKKNDRQPSEYSPEYKTLFGTTEEAGYITFFDALLIPEITHPLMADVMTVHHPDYYGDKEKPPADWDDPTPISFLSAKGSYLIALRANAPEMDEWIAATFEILGYALMELGIGAKTSSGYGRLKLDDPPPDPNKQLGEAIIRDVEAIPSVRVSQELKPHKDKWDKIPEDSEWKIKVAKVLKKAGKEWKKSKQSSWFVEVLQFLEKHEK